MIPCHSSLAHSILLWTVAVNVLNKQLGTGEKASTFPMGLSFGLIKRLVTYHNATQGPGLGRPLETPTEGKLGMKIKLGVRRELQEN
jgi:hypothetical protein